MRTKDGVLLKPIPVSPNADYMAGEDGKIYSRTKYAGFGKKVYVDWYALQGHRTPKGYMNVSLCHENKKLTMSVNRMVCMAFHGMPNPPTLQTRHMDGNPENNAPSNLVWGTQIENWQDRKAHGKPCMNPNYKFTPEERAHIRWAVSKGLCSQKHAARVLGCSQGSISGMLRG